MRTANGFAETGTGPGIDDRERFAEELTVRSLNRVQVVILTLLSLASIAEPGVRRTLLAAVDELEMSVRAARDVVFPRAVPRGGAPDPSVRPIPQQQPPSRRADDDRGGWLSFAGVVMLVVGVSGVIEGLAALLRPTSSVAGGARVELLAVPLGVWGWTHLALGALVAVAGVGVLAGRPWPRTVGVALAATGAVVELAFLAAYPVWALVVVTGDVAIILVLVTGPRVDHTPASRRAVCRR
jgi:hypothetical protein